MRVATLALAVAIVATSCGQVPAIEPGAPSRIAAGDDLTCLVVNDGSVACWGNRAYMGAGFTPGDAALGISGPVAVALPEGVRFTQVSASPESYGYRHACALASDGTVWCWGDSQVGQLGNGSNGGGETPVAVVMPVDTAFTQISLGAEHTCALDRDGAVWCWGDGTQGQLGDGYPSASEWESGGSRDLVAAPTRVLLPDVVVEKVSAGAFHTCALTTSGEVWCWGNDSDGLPKPLPVALVMPPGISFADLASDDQEMCGLTAEGGVWCWPIGEAVYDPGGTFDAAEPVAGPLPEGVRVMRLVAGGSHMCALSSDGVVLCWGARGGYGAAGTWNGEDEFPQEPAVTPVDLSSASGRRFTDVAAGGGHTCAIATDSTVWCWGGNDFGQLGDGTTESSLIPIEVPVDLEAHAPAARASDTLVLEPVVLEPYAGDAFLSPPPIWSLGTEQSRRIYGLLTGLGDWQIPEYWGLPEGCRGGSDEDGVGGSREGCLYAYLAELGVGLDALSLLDEYGITVSRVEGTGPVWVAETYDWSTFATNYDGATPNLVFTPGGIINVSGSGVGMSVDARTASTEAFAGDLDERIAEAENAEIYLGPYPENFVVPVAAPERLADGWSIRYEVQVGSGFHCCSYPFYVRFALDLDDAGSPSGVRFLDWCYVDRAPSSGADEPTTPEMRAIEEIGASLPPCSTR